MYDENVILFFENNFKKLMHCYDKKNEEKQGKHFTNDKHVSSI